MDKIIAACKQTGAEAVHPGYGFLSENAEFSRRLEEEGIVFIGPKHHSIAAMGDKIASKKLAREAGVNTIPGYNDPIETPDAGRRDRPQDRLPGDDQGLGRRRRQGACAWPANDKEAAEGFASCRAEAKNAFGDDRVFIEKFVEEPRHIEIQVLGDAHGNMVYLWERECSIQRRHQKVHRGGALALPRRGDPQGHGRAGGGPGQGRAVPVGRHRRVRRRQGQELLLPGDEHAPAGRAPGDRDDHRARPGRADDPRRRRRSSCPSPRTRSAARAGRSSAGSTPRTRSATSCPPPAGSSASCRRRKSPARCASTRAFTRAARSPIYYDSMIAKLITHGETRDQAIARMHDALNAFVIRGISSNIAFQAALIRHPRFVAGDFNTGFIAEEFPKGFQPSTLLHEDPLLLAAVAAYARRRYIHRAVRITGQLKGHERRVGTEWVVLMQGQRFT